MKGHTRRNPKSSATLFPLGDERQSLRESLAETKRELDLAHIGFNQTTDADLIEFYLFEIDALRARHTYLLRRIKALDEPHLDAPTQQSSTTDPPTPS